MYMTSLQKLRASHALKWVSLMCRDCQFTPSNPNLYGIGSYHIFQQFRNCSVERATTMKYVGNLGELAKKSRVIRREAQGALLEYLHSTRSLQFMDAENMSKNTPEYFDKLLKKVEIDDSDIGRSLTRFLRYHPINEFEPFFESIGLKPSEYSSFLPRNLMFLNDDEVLLDNYYALCNYGIARNRIGKIYKEAREIFRYGHGVLHSKLLSLQNLGLKQSLVVRITTSSPYLLRENVSPDFVEALGMLKKMGIDYDWLEEHISEGESCNWKCILELVTLLIETGLSEEQLGELIKQHPDVLLERSGRIFFCLFGFLLKFGFTKSDARILFLQFPEISFEKFASNLFQCYEFFVEIQMDFQDIGWIVSSHPLLLGSCELKKVKSLLGILNCGKKRLCQMILDDPDVLSKWVLGVRVDRLQETTRIEYVRKLKIDFLLNLGFVETSKEMERALKVFRGKGVELQERFDCLVNIGLSRDEAIAMVKVSPQILNQSKDVIKTKIDVFVKDLGYPVSALVTHPAIVSYTSERVKLRLLTYKWLRDQRAVHPKLALSTLLSCSEKIFLKTYVNTHPSGHEYWEKLKKELYFD